MESCEVTDFMREGGKSVAGEVEVFKKNEVPQGGREVMEVVAGESEAAGGGGSKQV